MFKLTNTNAVTRISDGAQLPAKFEKGSLVELDEHSPFVKELKDWLAAGNVPEAADPELIPLPPKSLVDQILDSPDFVRFKTELKKP